MSMFSHMTTEPQKGPGASLLHSARRPDLRGPKRAHLPRVRKSRTSWSTSSRCFACALLDAEALNGESTAPQTAGVLMTIRLLTHVRLADRSAAATGECCRLALHLYPGAHMVLMSAARAIQEATRCARRSACPVAPMAP